MMGPHPRKLTIRVFDLRRATPRDKPKAAFSPPLPPAAASVPEIKPATIEETRKRSNKRASAWLKQTFPVLFGQTALPLAIGLGDTIVLLALKSGFERGAIGAALHYATNGHRYIASVAADNSMRHNLAGEPVAPVSSSHRAHAQAQLAAIETKRAEARGKR